MAFYPKTKIFILSFILLAAEKAHACSVCFTQVKDDPQAIALKWAVLMLLAVVLILLAFTGKFIWDFSRREKLMFEEE